MTVSVDLDNQCPDLWVPTGTRVSDWLSHAWRHLQPDGPAVNVAVQVLNEDDTAALNLQFRGKSGPTNVLSFPANLPPELLQHLQPRPLGDIVACAPVIHREAREQGKTAEAHWAHLLTHGFLHLNGYDHQTDSEAMVMETLETRLLAEQGYPDPYQPGPCP